MHMHSSLPPPTLQTHRLQLMHPPPSLHDSSFMSQYQPIVPPPLGSPESMSSPIMLPFYNARILSPVRAPERQETPSKSRSPSRSFRERVTYDSGRGNERGRRYNSRQNESTLSSSYSNNRPYNSSYRPPSSRGSHHLSSSYHSNSSYQRPPFRQRNYSNDGNRNRPNHPSRGYNNISSHPSSSSNYPRRDNDRRY
ncbi:hypothetical protein GCK72_008440 [Caenorhabditis remanei]|uniref:Uncharacterized protein n=1 Tax=Caenorhabditis remanei TaxID=31234 RepID=A0A6A5H0A3_CAERE|nr:hypothetical protein GCK72_008440 [Caenorhabditis remanei]KAF1760194.1 hypothetical protein GCK72_008440 [Caenorhabditis remanei]